MSTRRVIATLGFLTLAVGCDDESGTLAPGMDGGGQVQIEGGTPVDAPAGDAASGSDGGASTADAETPDTAPPGRSLYVSPMGLDTNLGTMAAPLKTIAKALTEAKEGDTVWLLDGLWNAAVEPKLAVGTAAPCNANTGLVVPAGVTLQAVNPRMATLEVTGSHGVCLTSGTIRNVHFHRPSGQGGYIEVSGDGASLIEGSTFSGVHGCGGSGWEAAVETSDKAKVTISGGGLTTSLIDGMGCQFVVARGMSEVTIANALLQAGKSSNLSGSGTLIATDGATLRLKRTTLENAGTAARGFGLGTANVFVEDGSVVKGFQHGLAVRDKGTVITVQGSTFTGNTAFAIIVEYGYSGAAVVTATDSTFDGNGTAVSQGVGTGLDLRLKNSRIVNSTQNGLNLYAAGKLAIDGGEITGNKQDGIRFLAGGGDCTVNIRNAKITGNTDVGARLGCSATSVVDLGTLASPGNNTFTANGTTGLYVSSAGLTSQAVGNTWEPNVQAANMNGKYTVDGAGAKLEVTTGTGKNYQVLQGTLRLAENP